MTAAARKSHKRDTRSENTDDQARQSAPPDATARFAERLSEVLAGQNEAAIARAAGIPKQTLAGFKKGATPSAPRALALADTLGVNYRWLIAGEGPKLKVGAGPTEAESVTLPRYDVFAFGEYGRGEPLEEVTIPRWLLGTIKTSTGLWVTQMPSDALPDVAEEGDTIICRDPEAPLQDRRVYIFILDGRPIVRRVFVRPEGLLLTGNLPSDEIVLRPDELDRLMPAGRVLANARIDQV